MSSVLRLYDADSHQDDAADEGRPLERLQVMRQESEAHGPVAKMRFQQWQLETTARREARPSHHDECYARTSEAHLLLRHDAGWWWREGDGKVVGLGSSGGEAAREHTRHLANGPLQCNVTAIIDLHAHAGALAAWAKAEHSRLAKGAIHRVPANQARGREREVRSSDSSGRGGSGTTRQSKQWGYAAERQQIQGEGAAHHFWPALAMT